MRKKLIASLLSLSLPFSSLAKNTEGLYVKVGTGVNQVNPFNIADDEYTGKIKIKHVFPVVEVGVGYQFAQGIRTEAVFDYYFLFNSKERSKNRDGDKFTVDSKTFANAVLFNGYKDTFTFKNGITHYIGGGLGFSNLKEKAKGSVVEASTGDHHNLGTTKSKHVRRLAYKLSSGFEYNINDSFIADLGYHYFNLGYNKPKVIQGIENMQQRRYSVHSMILSLRYKV